VGKSQEKRNARKTIEVSHSGDGGKSLGKVTWQELEKEGQKKNEESRAPRGETNTYADGKEEYEGGEKSLVRIAQG